MVLQAAGVVQEKTAPEYQKRNAKLEGMLRDQKVNFSVWVFEACVNVLEEAGMLRRKGKKRGTVLLSSATTLWSSLKRGKKETHALAGSSSSVYIYVVI